MYQNGIVKIGCVDKKKIRVDEQWIPVNYICNALECNVMIENYSCFIWNQWFETTGQILMTSLTYSRIIA